MDKLSRLQGILGYEFSDPDLLTLALTHRSAGGRNNERLEFLGDSLVNHVVAEALYHRYPRAREGDLTRMRAALVRKDSLSEIAAALDLGEFLALGSGERKAGVHRRSSILADALEAVAGAILLDGGAERARDCVLAWFQDALASPGLLNSSKDPKTRLQEFLQGRHRPLPDYQLVRVEGEGHAQHFHVACQLREPRLRTEGSGSSRRRAEQVAAAAALQRLEAG